MRHHVIGNYKMLEPMGEGGMGKVFRGRDLLLERDVAIKLIRPEYARQPDFRDRFCTEAKALARLNHPNIVTLHAFFQHQDHWFMIMELVAGETLSASLARAPVMPWTQALPLFCQVLAGVEHAHSKGIIHRDIKPSNLILADTGLVKVLDFGLAQPVPPTSLTQCREERIGTLAYMAPEQRQGKAVDARSDIYSLGLVLYKMLTDQVPFVPPTGAARARAPSEETPISLGPLAPAVPAELEAIIQHALAQAPEQRVPTVGQFRTRLETLLQERPRRVEAHGLPDLRTDTRSAVSTAALRPPTRSDRRVADGTVQALDTHTPWLTARTATDHALTQDIFVEPDAWLPKPGVDPPADGSVGAAASPLEQITAVTASLVPPAVGMPPVRRRHPTEVRSAGSTRWSGKSRWGVSAALGLGMAVVWYAGPAPRAPESKAVAALASGSPRSGPVWPVPRTPETAIRPPAAPAGPGRLPQDAAPPAVEAAAVPPAPVEVAAKPVANPIPPPGAILKRTPSGAETTSPPAPVPKLRRAERPTAKTAAWRRATAARNGLPSYPTGPMRTSRELILSIFPRED